MAKYNLEPWPSTYEMIGEVQPRSLTSRFAGRKVGAFRSSIPAFTFEPPQIHLNAERDGKPFEEMITDFTMPFHVTFWDAMTGRKKSKEYLPGQNIVIPNYVIHWLVNHNDKRLEFTCEYAPHPWDGEKDEPEFINLETLLAFVDKKGLTQKLVDASDSIKEI
jgi:hypothetical protein